MGSREKLNQNILAIDIGYGSTKVRTESDRFVFPSGYAPFRTQDLGYGSTYGITVRVKGLGGPEVGPFIVGSTAARMTPGYTEPMEALGHSRLSSEDMLPILGEAIVRGKLQGDIILSTGGPLDMYAREKAGVQRWAGKTIEVATTDGRVHTVTITKVLTKPQGIAASIALSGMGAFPDIPEGEEDMCTLLDIGRKTTDVVTVLLTQSKIEPIKDLCFSLNLGVGDFLNTVGERLSRVMQGVAPPMPIVEDAVRRGKLKYAGQEYDMIPVVKVAREEKSAQLTDEVRRKFSEKAGYVRHVIGTGGGALPLYWGQVFTTLFPGADVLTPAPEDVVYLNVEGYYLFAVHVSTSAAVV